MKKRTLIGRVEHISLTGEEKCGGAAVNVRRMRLGASSVNMRARKMTISPKTRTRNQDKKK